MMKQVLLASLVLLSSFLHGANSLEETEEEHVLLLFSELVAAPALKKAETKPEVLKPKKSPILSEIPEEEILVVPFSEFVDSSVLREKGEAKFPNRQEASSTQEFSKEKSIFSPSEQTASTTIEKIEKITEEESPASFSHVADSTPKKKEKEPNPPIEPNPFSSPEEEAPVEALPSYKGAFAKMMLTLLGLIILIGLSVRMLRRISRGRFQASTPGRSIKIIERSPLSAKSVLYIVEVGSKKVLITESQVNVRAIATLDEIPVLEDE